VSQCFGAVDVLPVCVADIKGSQFLLARKLAHTIRQRNSSRLFLLIRAMSKSAGLHKKHACVEGVITGKIFADIDDMIRFAFDLCCVVEVKNTIHIVVDARNHLAICQWLLR